MLYNYIASDNHTDCDHTSCNDFWYDYQWYEIILIVRSEITPTLGMKFIPLLLPCVFCKDLV